MKKLFFPVILVALIYFFVRDARDDGGGTFKLSVDSNAASLGQINAGPDITIKKREISLDAGIRGPVEEVLPVLEGLASGGDSVAACRIAAEYELCGRLDGMRLDYDRWLADRELATQLTEGEGLGSLDIDIRREAEIKERQIMSLSRYCQNIDIPENKIDYWRRAALMGNVAAARYYASGNAFSNDAILDNLDKLAIYKAEAEGLALSVAMTGDLEMTIALAAAYSPMPGGFRPFLTQAIVKKDGAKALALFNRVENALVSKADPELNGLLIDIRQRIEELSLYSEVSGDKLNFDDWVDVEVGPGTRNLRGFGGRLKVGPRECLASLQ